MYKPIYRITPYLLKLITEASDLRSWIENAPLQVAWLPLLQKEARARTAHSSTSIEGNPLTLPQVEAVDRGETIGVPQKYEKEAANYLAALRWLEKHAHSAINEKTVLQLHRKLMQGLLPESSCGKYKERQNYVINGKGIKIYSPPSPRETPELVKALVDWINSHEANELHCIITSAILHHRMVSIHPFPDGNGRIARILGTWVLYQKGFDTHHIFSLDDFFAANRNKYYLKIQQARELDNDLTYWIEYTAEGINKTLSDVKKRIADLQVSTKAKITLTTRQEDILRILRDKSPVRMAEFKKRLKLTRSRINQLIIPLVKNKLVIKEGKSRATVYKLASFS